MSQRAMRAKKLGVTLLVSSVAASLSPLLASPAGAAPPAPPSIAAVCVNADNVNPFTDLGSASGEALAAINCLVDLGIVNGTTATTFSPTGTLTRQQGAALIARVLDAKKANDAPGGVTLTAVPATGPDQFTDDEGSTLEDSINRLAGVDIINGKTATLFDPTGPLTRGQFASLLDRGETYLVTGSVGGASPWATTTDFFTDDTGSVHEGAINRVASKGILVGDGNVTSGHGDPISRTQAALVMARVLAVNLADGLITAPPRAVTPGGTSFPANPATGATRQLGGVPNTDAGTGGVVEVRFTGLDPARVYDVALLQCGEDDEGPNVLLGTGTAQFSDQGLDNLADQLADTDTNESVIATVGFNVFNTPYVDGVSPDADGSMLVRVTSDDADCAFVVVWDDNADDNDIDLVAASRNSYNVPTAADKVGVAGPFVWHFGEAPTGAEIDGDVIYVDKTADFFVTTDGFRFNYDAADSGLYDGSDVDYPLSFANFEAYLSIGDYIFESGYSRTNPNIFEFDQQDTVNRPTNVVVTAVDLPAPDADTLVDDLAVSWTAPNPLDGDVDYYCVEIYQSTTPFTMQTSDCTDEVNTVGTGDAPTTLVFADVLAGGHTARVYACSEADYCSYYSQLSNVATTGAPADTTRPFITDARVTVDAGLQDRFDSLDVLTITFNEAMDNDTLLTDLDTDGVFVVTDADGDVFNFSCGGTAGCVLGPDGANPDRVLTLTLNGTIADTNGPGDGLLEMPATITTVNAAVRDVAGNVVNLATSTDIIVDKEAP